MKKPVLVGAIVLGLAATLGVMGLRTAFAGPTTTAIAQPTVFRDGSGQSALAIQLAPGRPDTGAFDFTLVDVGDYRGVIPLQTSGPQIIHPTGQVSGQFDAAGSARPRSATIRMDGEINASQHTAAVNVWVDGAHYLLTTPTVDSAAAVVVAHQALQLAVAKDWTTLYTLTAPDSLGTQTQAQYVQQMTSQAGPNIVSASFVGTGTVGTGASGYVYYSQPVSLQIKQPDGSVKSFTATLDLVWERGAWRVLTTTSPKPA